MNHCQNPRCMNSSRRRMSTRSTAARPRNHLRSWQAKFRLYLRRIRRVLGSAQSNAMRSPSRMARSGVFSPHAAGGGSDGPAGSVGGRGGDGGGPIGNTKAGLSSYESSYEYEAPTASKMTRQRSALNAIDLTLILSNSATDAHVQRGCRWHADAPRTLP